MSFIWISAKRSTVSQSPLLDKLAKYRLGGWWIRKLLPGSTQSVVVDRFFYSMVESSRDQQWAPCCSISSGWWDWKHPRQVVTLNQAVRWTHQKRAVLEKDVDKWASKSSVKFNKVKCKVLHLGWWNQGAGKQSRWNGPGGPGQQTEHESAA